MHLSSNTLSWLRDLAVQKPAAPADSDTIDRIREAAKLTPAWIEPYERIAMRMAAAETDSGNTSAVELLAELQAMQAACGQAAGVDFPDLAMSRAEWIGGNLFLDVDAATEAPTKQAMFRIIGVDPRVWDLTGIDGTRMEYTQKAVIVRHPNVSGPLEFVAGSY